MKGKFFRRNFVGLSKVIPMLVVVALIIAPLFSSVSASEPVTQGSLAVSGFLNRLAKSQAPSAAQSVDSMEVVASGLDNPRGLSFGPDGALYVAEAGRGGNGACLDTPEGLACLGLSGAVTRIFNGVQERVVTNLPSLADPDGFGANGLVSLVVSGKALDLLIGAGFSPEKRSLLGADGQGLGHAARFTNGKVFYGPDFLTYEALHNPDNGAVDSNAYGMAIVQPGVRAVADAGANDVLLVGVTGRMATLAVFPDRLDRKSVV